MVRVHLGLPVELREKNQHLQKERKRLTRTHVRDKPFGNGFESTWAYQANQEIRSEIFGFAKSEICLAASEIFDPVKSEIFASRK